MKEDCKSVIRGFESHLGLSQNTPIPAVPADLSETTDNPKLPSEPLTNRRPGYGRGCGKKPKAPPVFTYFIQSERGGPIKIGKAQDVKKRLPGIQNGNPDRLRVVATLEGDHEAVLHKRFENLRLVGEWFDARDELVTYLMCDLEADPTPGNGESLRMPLRVIRQGSIPLILRHLTREFNGLPLIMVKSEDDDYPDVEWHDALCETHFDLFKKDPDGREWEDHEKGCECEWCELYFAAAEFSTLPIVGWFLCRESFTICVVVQWPEGRTLRGGISLSLSEAAQALDASEMNLCAFLLKPDGECDRVDMGALYLPDWHLKPPYLWCHPYGAADEQLAQEFPAPGGRRQT